MLCSGTLHQHNNHGNNRNKKPDVTGICCLNIPISCLFQATRWEGQIFPSTCHYVPLTSLTAVFEDASFQEPTAAPAVGSAVQMGVIRRYHKPKN